MRNIFIVILLLLFGCAAVENNTYFQPKSTGEQLPQSNYFDQGRIIKKYPPPKTLEQKESVFSKLSSFPPVKVALLVPLSGSYKDLGQNLLDSAQMALFSIDEPNLIIVPIDTKGTSFGAVEAAKQAVADGAKIILGPVFSKSAQAIGSIAQKNNISVVSFSNDNSLANSGVYAIGFRPEQQIQRVIEYAMRSGIEDFATVIPNNAYGATAAKKLRETVALDDKASVLKTEFFRTDSSGVPDKLSEHVYSAFDSLMNTKSPKDYDEELKKYNQNPIKYPRAMLVPQGGKQLQMITDLLKKFKMQNEYIKLLGSSQWYDSDVLNNPVLEGSWFAAPPKERRDRFEANFEQTYGYKPNVIASLAYDGVALVATIARITGGKDFSKEKLENPRGFMGVDGIFRFKHNGLTERGLAVIEIKDGKYVIVSPSPSNFFEVERPAEDEKEENNSDDAVD